VSIENLRVSLQKSVELEIQNILQKAREEAERIMNEAKMKAERMKKAKLEDRIEEVKKKEENELATIRSNQRLKLLKAKDEILQEIFVEARKKLEEEAESAKPRYFRFLQESIVAGLTRLSGERFVIFTNERDMKSIEKALEGIETKATEMKKGNVALELSSRNLKTIGGALVCTQDQNRCYNDTIEARLEEYREIHASKAIEILFEEE